MTYRNKAYDVGDLVEAVWLKPTSKEPCLTGIIVSMIDTTMGLKVKVLWNEIGVRTEWISDIKRVN
jgi:uncharacterized OB-fold protein